MKKYFCDVCGAELANGGSALALHPVQELCGLEDLCPRCEVLVQRLNVSCLIWGELRRLIDAKPEEPEPPTPAPPLKGKAAREKREILAAVEAYRKENKPGSISKLAKLAEVDEGDIREMISFLPVPIKVWRAVGKALGVTGAAEEKE